MAFKNMEKAGTSGCWVEKGICVGGWGIYTEKCEAMKLDSYLSWMNNQRHVTVVIGCKTSKGSNDEVLSKESIHMPRLLQHSHHELDVVYYNMADVMHVCCMRDSLKSHKILLRLSVHEYC